jgi:hypothetical protein
MWPISVAAAGGGDDAGGPQATPSIGRMRIIGLTRITAPRSHAMRTTDGALDVRRGDTRARGDCPKQNGPHLHERCDLICPDLPKVL